MTTLFLIWQDPETRRWHPVGRMDRRKNGYIFGYTSGALDSPRFVPFGNMVDMSSCYVSDEIFPLFGNRMMGTKRPEFSMYSRWSDLADSEDPLLLMARMGGTRATDTLQVYQPPERNENTPIYQTTFFCHGIGHMSGEAQMKIFDLSRGDRLLPLFDIQNHVDEHAVALRLHYDPPTIIGYCPRHLAIDLKALAAQSGYLEIQVRKVNRDAPPKYQLLCDVTSLWPSGFKPCDHNDYRTIATYFDEMSVYLENNVISKLRSQKAQAAKVPFA
jgi:hypothetical protein